MKWRRYKARHLRRPPVRRGPVVLATATAITASGSAAHAGTHLVRRGETLTSIARRYGTSVARLVRLNDIADPDVVVAGRRLRVPGAPPGSRTHTVQSGETLSGIAARYGTTVAALVKANRLRDPNVVLAGAQLTVPARLGSAARATPSPGSRSYIEGELRRHAAGHGVSTSLVKAVAWQESGWQQDVVSTAGAIGVMQVMPASARFVNRQLGGGRLKVRDASDNIHLGVMYLRHLLGTMGSERRALAGYYSGPGNVGGRLERYQRTYVRSVLALRSRFS